MLLFALLVLLAYAYWHLTNEARIQQRVEAYLDGMLAGPAKVKRARFRLFSGIRIEGMKLFSGETADLPFFAGDAVLYHQPWELFQGRMEATEIVSAGGRVRMVWDVRQGKYLAQGILRVAGPGGALGGRLPAIRLRDVTVEWVDLLDGQIIPRGPPVRLSMSLIPDAEQKRYNITLEDTAGPSETVGWLDPATGQITITKGQIGPALMDKVLPRKWLDWKERHKVVISEPLGMSMNWGGTGDAQSAVRDHLSVKLTDVSMELPPEEGGLKLNGVSGTLVLRPDGVVIEKLTGRIGNAGESAFTLSGRYDGYKPTSDFSISLTIAGLRLPLPAGSGEAWGPAVAKLFKQVKPTGPVSMQGTLRRRNNAALEVFGAVTLQGVSAQMPAWPIRVEGLRGRIEMNGDELKLVDLRGRRGDAEVIIGGRMANLQGRMTGRIVIDAKGMAFSEDLREAMPSHLQKAWDMFSPRGKANFRIVWSRTSPAEESTTMLTIVPNQGTSIEYVRFPYRLDWKGGEVDIRRGQIHIRSLRGTRGKMSCTLKGTITPSKDKIAYDISFQANDLPLDDNLARALPEGMRRSYEACGLAGWGDVTEGRFRRLPGQEKGTYDVRMALTDATIRHRRFPYSIEHATGTLRLTNSQVTIERLVGRHGRGKITLSGKMVRGSPFDELSLDVEGSEMEMNAELRQALPPAAREGWDMINPAGTADVTLSLRGPLAPAGQTETLGAGDNGLDYHLAVRPRDLQVRCRYFPYPLRRVRGTVIIVPGKATLMGITGLAGSASVAVEGTIRTTPGRQQADLVIRTDPVRVDKNLLAALPAGLVETLGLKPGGTMTLNLEEFHVRPIAPGQGSPTATTRPAEGRPAPTSAPFRVIRPGDKPAPTGRNDARFAWRWKGRIDMKDANLDLGLGGNRFTGSIEGEMDCPGPLTQLRADVMTSMSALRVGSRRLERFTARVTKDPKTSVLRIGEFSGRAYGGRVAGFAEINLRSPRTYGVSLSAENIDLAKFVGATVNDATKKPGVKGVLTGNLQLTATTGKPGSRQARGEIRITEAKLYKLPIVLGFLHVINLTLPSESAFHGAEVEYYLQGDKLVFRRIYLQGSALSMLGAGKMDMKTQKLDLTFLVGPARKLPDSPIREFLQAIAGQLMTVRVTGTLAKPKHQTIPLRNLDDTLQEVFRPEER